MAVENTHTENLVDNDRKFLIDPQTRTIKNASYDKELVQYDSSSEVFTFEMPRYVEGHDMGTAKNVKVYYVNKGTSEEIVDSTDVTSTLKITDDGTNTAVFSWTIPANATQHEGTLDFAVTFTCPEVSPDYIWSTKIYSGIVINKGLRNSSEIIKRDPDAFDAILTRVSEAENKIESAENKAEAAESKVNEFDDRVMALENKPKVEFFSDQVYEPGGSVHRDMVIIDGTEYIFENGRGYPGNLTFQILSKKVVDAISTGSLTFMGADMAHYSITDYTINYSHQQPGEFESVVLICNAQDKVRGNIYVSDIQDRIITINKAGVDFGYIKHLVSDKENSVLIFELGTDGIVTGVTIMRPNSADKNYDTTNTIPSDLSIIDKITDCVRGSNPIIARIADANDSNNHLYYYLNNFSCVGDTIMNSQEVMPYNAKNICLNFNGYKYENDTVTAVNCCILINRKTKKITYSIS